MNDFLVDMMRHYERNICPPVEMPSDAEGLKAENHRLRKKVRQLEIDLVELETRNIERFTRLAETLLASVQRHLPEDDVQ